MENNQAFERFTAIGEEMRSAHQAEFGQMFGKKVLKHKGKAFAAFYRDEMVFKLKGVAHREALSKEGAKLWDPSGKNMPMKEWVQVGQPFIADWRELAESALKSLEEK
ncbi:hypothetical protein [Paenibacillus sp. MBLB4367]|uniref:hypothetical protein n=1 Tax=Paenibacillus sp. MBLB4367 TaxID=3384767 RepID=UPI003907F78A